MVCTLQEIITRDRGEEAYAQYVKFENADTDVIVRAARQTLEVIPPSFGSGVMVSAGFVAILKSVGVEAVVILGDLKIDGRFVFICRGNIPGATYDGEVVEATWDGHAWVMLGDMICDLSIFRSAYSSPQPNHLQTFINRHFGEGKGALLVAPGTLPPGMEFVPKHALKDDQICGILDGLSKQAAERSALT